MTMALDSLPTEITLNIAYYLYPSLASLNALCQTDKRLHSILERTLYTEDVQHHRSSSVSWAARHGNLAVLRKAINLGKAQIPTRKNYAYMREDGSMKQTISFRSNRGTLYGQPGRVYYWEVGEDHPICVAARNGHNEVVRFLLDEVGCSPHIKDGQDFCLLSLAIEGGLDKELIQTFLDCGVHQYVRNINGYCPLHIAAFKGDEDLVQSLLLRTRPDYLEQQIQDAFQSALLANQIPATLQMLDYGGVNLNCHLGSWTQARETYMTTPLGWAVFHENLDLVEKFLDNGADVDFTLPTAQRLAVEWRVLFDAVERSQAEMVKLLVKRSTNRVACTKALSLAVERASSIEDPSYKEYKVFRILLKNAVSCNFKEDDIQPPPPPRPQRGDLGRIMCSYPVKHRQNGEFIPPIVHAVLNGNLRIVQILLSYGADVNTSYRQLQITKSKFCCGRILDLAKDLGHQQIADFLLKCGAQPDLGPLPYEEAMQCGVASCPVFRERMRARCRELYPFVDSARPTRGTSPTE